MAGGWGQFTGTPSGSASTSPLKSWWAIARHCPLQKASGQLPSSKFLVGNSPLPTSKTQVGRAPVLRIGGCSRSETEMASVVLCVGVGCGLHARIGVPRGHVYHTHETDVAPMGEAKATACRALTGIEYL